jgi:SH3 domain protein
MNSKRHSLRRALRRAVCTAMIAALCSTVALAETIYVTDELQLDLYLLPDLSGAPIRKLRSGDRMELIERDGRYSNVRTEDGQAGWVKSLYLVSTEPARTRVNQLEKSNEGLEATVKKLRSQLTGQKDQVAELQNQQSGAAEQNASAAAELKQLKEDNADLAAKLDSYGTSVPVSWLLTGLVVMLIGGFVGGWYFVDRRSRSKHGGYRIY